MGGPVRRRAVVARRIRDAFAWTLAEAATKQSPDRRWRLARQRTPVGVFRDDERQCIGDIVSLEGSPTREHLVKHASERPHVAALVRRSSFRPIIRRAERNTARFCLIFGELHSPAIYGRRADLSTTTSAVTSTHPPGSPLRRPPAIKRSQRRGVGSMIPEGAFAGRRHGCRCGAAGCARATKSLPRPTLSGDEEQRGDSPRDREQRGRQAAGRHLYARLVESVRARGGAGS